VRPARINIQLGNIACQSCPHPIPLLAYRRARADFLRPEFWSALGDVRFARCNRAELEIVRFRPRKVCGGSSRIERNAVATFWRSAKFHRVIPDQRSRRTKSVLRNSDQAAREILESCLWVASINTLEKRVNAAGRAGESFGSGVHDKGRDILHQLQACPLPARFDCPAIYTSVIFELSPPMVDRNSNCWLSAKFVKHP